MTQYACMRRVATVPGATLAALLLAALAPRPVVAQSAPPSDAVTPGDLAAYDTNHNGTLDPEERAQRDRDRAAAAAAHGAAASSDKVVQMSPFQVSAADNKGYYAANTLSGTRLNAKLEDLGASISVVTKQQMQDFALLDVNDIFMYEASTEGTENYTDFTVDRNGGVIDNVQANPNGANRVRGIAPANLARGNYEMSGAVPLDPIDMDAVEISRGPNSSIFGLGNASGTVNIIPAQANLQRPFTRVEGRVDSLGSTRSSLDLNRPILKDKLAVRANAVFEQNEFERKPSVDRSKRYNGMFTWTPFKYTTVRGSVQYYEDYARRPNAILPRDGMSYWEQNGRPVWDAAASTVTRNGVSTVVPYNANQGRETTALGPGLESPGSALYARSSLFVNPDGSIGEWSVGRQSGFDPNTGLPSPVWQGGNARFVESGAPPSPGPLYATTTVPLTDKSRYDWTSINLAAPNWSRTRSHTYTVELEQFFVNTQTNLLGLQLGWNREETNSYSRNFIGQGGGSPMIVYIDVNKTLLDGTPNPYFLHPYINASEPTAYRTKFFRDTFRGQLAYQLKLSQKPNWLRWLGDHQLSGYAEYKNSISAPYAYHDVIVDNHSWLPAGANRANGAAVARGYYRYYVGDGTGDNVDFAPPALSSTAGTYNLEWYNAATKQWVHEPATIGQAYFQAGRTWRSRNLIKTQGAVLQSHFLDDRVVPTFGLRRDSNLNRDSAGTGLQPDGITEDQTANRTWPNDWLRRDGRTTSSGVVVKPLRHWQRLDRIADQGGWRGFVADAVRSLDLFYNRSDSFLPQSIAQNLAGVLLPDATGKGKDYGFALSFFHNRLVVRYSQYNNVQQNTRFGDSGIIASRAARLDFSNITGGADRFNLYRNAREWVMQFHPTWTTDQVETEVAKEMGFPPDQLARMNAYPIADTSDVTAKGREIEVNFNSNRYFRSKLNVAQQESINNHMSPGIQEYFDARMPLWTTIVDPRTNTTWWTTRYGSGGTPEQFFVGSVQAPYHLAVANEGKTRSQIRQWRVNALGSLQLAAFSDNKWLQRTSVMGAVRWEDKASIGYFTLPDDPNTYDPNRPIYDKGHTYLDAGVSYAQKIYHDRVVMHVQLNVRNLTENGRLQPVAAFPNGEPFAYRIIDPRLFIFTVGFDL